METGVSESVNGDQPDDVNDSSLYWKLKIPRERILFVDTAGSEEFNLLLTALDEAKIVAMDAEWKPVRKAGVLPRVSILQLSCRMDQNSRSWANMERVILSRKIRVEAEESLEAQKLQLDAEMQKQKDAIQKQQQKVDRDRWRVEKEGRKVKVQRERFEKERAEKKKRDVQELENLRTRRPSAEDGDGDDGNKLTMTKLGDGLKGLFLGRNGEVSEFCEDLESLNPSTEADHKDSSKKVNSDDAEQNVDNLLDVLAQAEKEMLKHQQGEQHTIHTEANLETLSKDTSDIAPNYVSPGKNFEDETSVRSKDTEIEVDKVNRHFDLNGGDDSREQQMPAKSSDRIDLGLNERDIDGSMTKAVGGRSGNVVPPLSKASVSQSFKDCSDSFYEAGNMEEQKKPPKKNLENGSGGIVAASGFGRVSDTEEEEDSGPSTSEELETQSDRDLDGTADFILGKSSRGHNNAAGIEGLTEEENKRVEGEEVIFLLDLMSLSAEDFSSALKKMLCSPQVVKLGFAFKQDQLHLAATFPGPEARECFEKVVPYIDMGKLFKQLRHGSSANMKHRGKRLSGGGAHSLTGIMKTVLGAPLCKDAQCSNWEQRPLSHEQIKYAAADTQCLLALFDSLLSEALRSIGPCPAQISTAAGGRPSLMRNESSLCGTNTSQIANYMDRKGLKLLTGMEQEKTSVGHIVTHKMGVATEMVEAALHLSPTSSLQTSVDSEKQRDPLWRYSKFMKRYSECLLASGENCSKSRVHKPRARRAREGLKNGEARDELLNWVGPAPWDVMIGGDGKPKFLCDVMVEGLARQLRCIGVDAATPPTKKSDPRKLVEQAIGEGRVLLTKDMKLLERRLMPDNLAYYVRKSGKWEQLVEVMKVFEISVLQSDILSRCVKCNGEFIPKALTPNEAKAAAPAGQEIPVAVLKSCDHFWQCSMCFHLFWQGSQFNRAREQFTAACVTQEEIPDERFIQPLDVASDFLEEAEEAFAHGSL